MNDSRLLYEAFNAYYERGMNALKNNNLEVARRNILAAAETLLKLAKESSGELKNKRVKRAEELNELATKIEEKAKIIKKQVSFNANDSGIENNSSIKVVENDSTSIEDAINSLESLEGLKEVKTQVSDLIDQIKVFQMRKAKNLPTPEMSYHMVFTGNPGTGKTTVARIIGKIYRALGILSKGHLVEVDRSDLVAGYVGQTALKTKEVISKAMGGVLFIDEAYSLKKEGNDFGQEAIDTLNKAMEDSRGDLVVIVAGYKNEIKTFIDSNQGLRSRFRTYIDFKDYSGQELYNIFLNILEKNKYQITNSANNYIYNYLNDRNINQFTGNARDVRNMFENIVKLQSRRVARLANPSAAEITTITDDDLPFDKDLVSNNINVNESENTSDNLEEPEIISHEPIINLNSFLQRKKKSNNDPKKELPEEEYLENNNQDNSEYKFDWDSLPNINFDDIAGLENVKEVVRTKVLLPLEHPEAFEGYVKKNGGGLFLYGPPGTGKTMIAAAIANEIGAKFCSVKPSDLLHQGGGNTEKAVRTLFAQARQFPCAIIYFDEMDSIAQKNTKSSYARQLRSELLAQIQGVESYGEQTGNILFLIAATNKPWDVDSAFVRPGRFGTPLYVGLPEDEAREYIVLSRLNKIKNKGIVSVNNDIDVKMIVEQTNGFNGSDITNLLDRIEEISVIRGVRTGDKYICQDDVEKALENIHSSVQIEDIEKLMAWKEQNNG